MNNENKKNYSVMTDLAIEAKEICKNDDGVGIETAECNFGTKVTWVNVESDDGAKSIGKPKGHYVTLESPLMKENHREAHEEISKILVKCIHRLTKLSDDAVILVVGLGNEMVTPDALGPKVVSKTLVTRHIKESIPQDLNGKVRSVCAIAPGVMGITGIETLETIKGVVSHVKPDLVIAVDALAARRTSRINATIQMSDTGVSPGAGIGNKRAVMNKESLGVPVLAIGVPTVVDAATLVNDTLDSFLEQMLSACEKGSEFYSMLSDLSAEEKYGLITEALSPYSGNLFVTPKEIDACLERLAVIIANALNMALHPGISAEDINRFLG